MTNVFREYEFDRSTTRNGALVVELGGMPVSASGTTIETHLFGKPTLFQLAIIKALYDLDRVCIQLNDAAAEFVSRPTLENLAKFCLVNRIAWHECYDSALMNGEFSPQHIESFISCSSRQDVADASRVILRVSDADRRKLAEHYIENIQRRLQFARMALQGGLESVYDDQRQESIRQMRQSHIPAIVAGRSAIEQALSVNDTLSSASSGELPLDAASHVDFARTTFSWLRHRLLLQLTELLFERGPYATAVASHLKIARSIHHCFKIALQIFEYRTTPASNLPSVFDELRALLVDFEVTIVAKLESANEEVQDPHVGFSVEEIETRAKGNLDETLIGVSELLGRLRECSELLQAFKSSLSPVGRIDQETRVLLYKREDTYYAHDLDSDLIAHDKASYDSALDTLRELQSVASARRAGKAVVPAQPAPSRLLEVWQRSSNYLKSPSTKTYRIDARLES